MSDPRPSTLSPHRPLVSVVIPTWNRAVYLETALASALSQTLRDREILVVDDGSTDDTPRVLERHAGAIRVVLQEHRGVAAARNRGIAEARGEWVAYLDSDDTWEPQALERLIAAAEAHPDAGLITMRAQAMSADGTLSGRTYGKHSPGPWFTTESLLTGDGGGVLTPMVRRDLYLELGGFDENLRSAEDVDMWLRLSLRTRLYATGEALLHVRAHAQNLSRDRSLNARTMLLVLDKLEREHPEWVRAHPRAFRRGLGKEHLRAGRELLAASAQEPQLLEEARRHLARSVAIWPWFLRAHVYRAWGRIAPRSFGAWRAREMRRR